MRHEVPNHKSEEEGSYDEGEEVNPFHCDHSMASTHSRMNHKFDLDFDIKVDVLEFEGRM